MFLIYCLVEEINIFYFYFYLTSESASAFKSNALSPIVAFFQNNAATLQSFDAHFFPSLNSPFPRQNVLTQKWIFYCL